MAAGTCPLRLVALLALVAVFSGDGGVHGWVVKTGSSRQTTIEGTALALSGSFKEVGYSSCMAKCNLMYNDSSATTPSSFSFYRANNPLYYMDMASGSGVQASPLYEADKGVAWLQGDMHILNMGTYAIDTGVGGGYSTIFDVNDFDESWTGSWLHDMYRLATSFVIAGRASGLSDTSSTNAVKELALRYSNKLRDFKATNDEDTYTWDKANSKDVPRKGNGAKNNVVYKLLDKATKGSAAARRKGMLDKYSTSLRGVRTFKFTNKDVIPVSSAVRSAIIAALPSYYNAMSGTLKGQLGYFAVQDVAQRVNAGLGSFGSKRYYVIVEGATSDADDDRILDIKIQGLPRPRTHGFLQGPAYTSYPNASQQALRVSAAYKKLIYKADDHIGELTLTIDGITNYFSVRERSPEKQGPDPTPYTATELFNMAAQYGRVLASSHSKTDGSGVNTFESQVYTKLAAYTVSAFQTHLATFAVEYANQVNQDWALFKQSFASNPTLWCGSSISQ